jgi:hypothetical protein
MAEGRGLARATGSMALGTLISKVVDDHEIPGCGPVTIT